MEIFFDHKIFSLQNYGGPSRYFVNLANKLNEIETVNAKIFSPIHINYMLSGVSKNNIGFANKIPFAGFLGKSNTFKNNIIKINNRVNNFYIKKRKPDIIHTTYYGNDFPIETNNLVVTVYDLIHEIFAEEYTSKNNHLPKKDILDRAKQIICISESTKKDLIKFYNIREEIITVTHLSNSLASNNDSPQISKTRLPKKFFLYVGSRWKYKNFSQLLHVLNYNKNLHNEFDLVTFGGGKLTHDEKKLIKKLGLNHNKIIQIDGNESLLRDLYKQAEFFIYPSRYEGFGIPILESFSQECPVLCSNTSSFPEVAGDAAIFFDPNDIESISKSIEKITHSGELRQKLIKSGNERLQKFSWTKCASETLNVYKKIIELN